MSATATTDLTSDFLDLSWEADTGLEEGFFGQHMSATELDAEFIARLEPSRFADISSLQDGAWFGYRFLPPGLRVYLFTHFYQKAYRKTLRLMGRRYSEVAFMKANPLLDATKAQITGLVTATLTADAHGIPYEFYLEHMMDFHLRGTLKAPPQPSKMYHPRGLLHVLNKWDERNAAGIYLARAPQYLTANYEGHPWQDAYQDYLLELVARKGNKAFWLSRLIYAVNHVSIHKATIRFGSETVADALRFV